MIAATAENLLSQPNREATTADRRKVRRNALTVASDWLDLRIRSDRPKHANQLASDESVVGLGGLCIWAHSTGVAPPKWALGKQGSSSGS